MKTRYLIHSLLGLMLALFLVTSCTHNNGDIGEQFGQWKLMRIERNGVVDDTYGGNMFWSFQSSTIEMKIVALDHSTRNTFGNYNIENGLMHISFPDDDRTPPDGLGLTRDNDLKIVTLSDSRMTLSYKNAYVPAGGGEPEDMTLYFTKW